MISSVHTRSSARLTRSCTLTHPAYHRYYKDGKYTGERPDKETKERWAHLANIYAPQTLGLPSVCVCLCVSVCVCVHVCVRVCVSL